SEDILTEFRPYRKTFTFLESAENKNSGKKYTRKHRKDNTYSQCYGKPLNRSCTENIKHYRCQQRGDVTIDNCRKREFKTFVICFTDIFTGKEFFFSPFIYNYVRINRHRHRQYDTRDTGKRECCIHRIHDSHQVEKVD